MKRALEGIKTSTQVIFIALFSFFTIAVYLLLSFLTGWEALTGIRGTDTYAYLSWLKFLSSYFPHYPLWNYLQGAGLPAMHVYPILSHTFLILASRLSGMNLVEVLKLAGFLSIPLFALGIFVFSWVRFRLVVVAFLAGFFYILSPIAWVFLFEWGFYAETVSAVLFPVTLLSYSLFINLILDRKEGILPLKTRLYFLLTVVFLVLSLLAHPAVLIGEVSFIVMYTTLLWIFNKGLHVAPLLKFYKYLIVIFVCFLALSAFWMVPFYRALHTSGLTSAWGAIDAEGYYETQVKLPEVLSFRQVTDWKDKAFNFRNVSFPLGISLLYFVGIASAGLLKRKRTFALLLTSLFCVIFSTNTPLLVFLSRFPFMPAFTSWRSLIYGARMFVPIGAAFGAYGIFYLLLFIVKPKVKILVHLKEILISLLALGFVALILFLFREKPLNVPLSIAYGRGGNTRDIWHVRADNLCFSEELTQDIAKPYCRNELFKAKINVQEFLGQCDLLVEVFQRKFLPEICSKGNFIQTKDVQDFLEACRMGTNPDFSETICKARDIKEIRGQCDLLIRAIDRRKILPKMCIKGNPIETKDVEDFLETCQKGSNPDFSKTVCLARVEPLLAQLTNRQIWFKKLKEFPESEEVMWGLKPILDLIPDNNFVRYDSSPNIVIYSMLGPYIKTTTPQLSTYLSSSTLITQLWGYYVSNFYVNDPVYTDPAALPELANWFGTKYFITGPTDPVENLKTAGFKTILQSKENLAKSNIKAEVYELPDAEPIVALSTKPTVLVIGKKSTGIYDIIFQKAALGVIPYKSAFLVKGKEALDDYSLEELKNFEVLILYGYKYRNKSRAWRLLDQYIKEGGRVFIGTGWQYESADWKVGKTPEFFPTTTLSWKDFGKTKDYGLHDGLIDIKGIDIDGFEPLVWNDQPWGVSSGDEVRPWAKTILSVKGFPLVAGGEYGRGKIIWSGMNLINHADVFDSKNPEIMFIGRLMEWLLRENSTKDFVLGKDFFGERPSPDKAVFTLNTPIAQLSGLYFKESYYLYWKAKLIKSDTVYNLKIEKAGPGFMYVKLPPLLPGDRIIFLVRIPAIDIGAYVVSFVTLAVFLTYLFAPKVLVEGRRRVRGFSQKTKLFSLEDEEPD